MHANVGVATGSHAMRSAHLALWSANLHYAGASAWMLMTRACTWVARLQPMRLGARRHLPTKHLRSSPGLRLGAEPWQAQSWQLTKL